ncbi:MAG: ABC transporter substrate-binding protein, partial [Patescibacteria group bacterium]
ISMTGVAAGTGEYAQKALVLAEEEINNNGGIDGRPVEITIEDDVTDPTKAVTAFNKLVDVDKVEGVIGSLWDFTTQPLMPLALSKKIALISPTNFRIAGSFDLNDYSFVMLSDFSKVVATLEGYLKDSKAEKVAVVHYNSGFGAEIAKTLNTVMVGLGKPAVLDESYNTLGGNDFRTTVLKLKTAGVDTVFIDALDIDTLNFLQRSKELGYTPTIITHVLILDALQNADVDKTLLEGVVVLNWETSSADFEKVFTKKYGIGPAKSADKVYDTVYVLAEAIAKAESTDQVATYLETTEFKTINGKISFTTDHASANTPVKVQVIKNGVLTGIK